MKEVIRKELKKIKKWLHVNKLSLNLDKRYIIIFSDGSKSIEVAFNIEDINKDINILSTKITVQFA